MPKKLLIKGKSIRKLNVISKPTAAETVAAPEAIVNGRVLDGYVRNSKIDIIDVSTGKVIATAVSSRDGSYTADLPPGVTDIRVVATGGIDISTEKPFAGRMKTVIKKPVEVTEITANVTPITTIVSEIVEKAAEPELTDELIQNTKTTVANSLQLEVEELEQDFIQEKNPAVTKKASQIATVIKLSTNALQAPREVASTASTAAIAHFIDTEVNAGLTDDTSLQDIISWAAENITQTTNDDTAERDMESRVVDVAKSVQVLTDTIEQVDETIDPLLAIEAIAEVNAVTDVIVAKKIDVVTITEPEVLERVVEEAQVFQVDTLVKQTVIQPIHTWTLTPYPPSDFASAFIGTSGEDFITVNIINDWRCTKGQFDPFSLSAGVLKRLNSSVAGAAQSVTLKSNTDYIIDVTGSGRIKFNGIVNSSGAFVSDLRITDTTITISAIDTITTITVELTDDDELSLLSIKEIDTDIQIVSNGNFMTKNDEFYEIHGWHLDQPDPSAIDPYSIGWVQGFNEHIIYSLFRDPVIEV